MLVEMGVDDINGGGTGSWRLGGRGHHLFTVLSMMFVASRQCGAAEDWVGQARLTCFHGDGDRMGKPPPRKVSSFQGDRHLYLLFAASVWGNQVLFEDGPLAPSVPLRPPVVPQLEPAQFGVCPAWPVGTHMKATLGCFIQHSVCVTQHRRGFPDSLCPDPDVLR